MYLHKGVYKKGIMEWDLDNSTWRFSQRRRNGTELFGVSLPNFCQSFQKYIDDGTLIPGWHGGNNFTPAGIFQHVSATGLHCSLTPGSLSKALHCRNPDKNIWLASYKEEYEGLQSNSTFDVISEAEYHSLCKQHGVQAIPSMCTFTVKKTNGVPVRAKSCIVVLGNFDPRPWSKSDCSSPVVSIPASSPPLRFITNIPLNKGTASLPSFKLPFLTMRLPS